MFCCDASTWESPVLSCLRIQCILMWQERPLDGSRKITDEQIISVTCLISVKEHGLILAHSSKSHSPEWQQEQEVAGRMTLAVRKQWAVKASAQLLFFFSPGFQPMEQYCFCSCRSFQTRVLLPWRLSIIHLAVDIDDHNDIWLRGDRWRRDRWRWLDGEIDGQMGRQILQYLDANIAWLCNKFGWIGFL